MQAMLPWLSVKTDLFAIEPCVCQYAVLIANPAGAAGKIPGQTMKPRSSLLAALFAAIAVPALLLPLARGQDAPFKKDERGPIDLHTQKTLYVVPYAHLDTQWRWTYPQVVREFIANTLHNNFALIDKYPNYVFNFSGSRRYEMMHEYYPEDWERLKGYIKAGRWFPCGSSVDEGDANVPGLESMIRHVLYGNHYFRREFDVASNEFMLPDCFGFPASLPTILVHCGIKGFSTQKLTWQSAVGIPFKIGNWIGPDGSPLPAALDPGSYTGKVEADLSQSPGWLARIDHTGAESGIYADYHYYGTGDRGGAPADESVNWVEKSVAGSGPLRVVSSTAEQMFLDLPADARARLPHYQGDLLLVAHSAGSITSEAYMKRWNRKNELLADAAERAAVTAAWLGGAPYPAEKLYRSWDLTLGSQMHDMLPGTSLPKAYEYCWNDEILAANGFAAVATDSAGAVIAALDTQTRGTPAVVYNPLSTAREDVVEGSIPAGENIKAVQVLSSDGVEVPTQITRHEDGKIDFIFLASVPPVSFTSFEVFTSAKAAAKKTTPLRVSNRTLENERYRVAVNDGGDVASIFDKAAGRELLSAPIRLEFHPENPVRYPAWNMDWSDRQKPTRGFVDGPASIRIVEDGPARVALEIERRAEGSRFVSRVSLAAGGAGNAVEFHDQIDWNSRECSLRAAFPLTVGNPNATYDDKVGVVVRGNNEPNKYEVPQHEWFDLTDAGGAYGVSVLNDCKFGSDKPDDHTVRLTLLYTPGVRTDFQDQGSQDFGRHDIAYAVAGHPGSWQQGGVVARAHRFNQPLRAFSTPAHPGSLGRTLSFASLDNPQVEITALKKAEDSDETIVRLRELGGQTAQTARLKMAAPILAAREVDGQERPLDHSAADLRDGKLTVQMAPFSLRTFALKLGPPSAPVSPPVTMPLPLAFDDDVVSTRANYADGGFDREGRTFPAEMLPATIVSEGIPFQMGPTADGQKNALACHGQIIPFPKGYDRVVLLAAADGDKPVIFKIATGDSAGTDSEIKINVQDWSGYLGQWDNRLWKGEVPDLAYVWNNPLDGLAPGFVKPATVAWYSSHRNNRAGVEFYKYCYLYKYDLDLPKDARSLVLPDEPSVRIFAVTMLKSGHDAVQPMEPLFDTLADHVPDAPPAFQPSAGQYRDSLLVTIPEPLYRQDGGLHYTSDGSEPSVDSPRYSGPIPLHANAVIKARMFLPNRPEGGPVTTAHYEIDDRTPPTLRSASANSLQPEVRAVFSEPVSKASAEAIANYRLEPAGDSIQSARLSDDGFGVVLALQTPLASGASYRLIADGVRDLSPVANAAAQAECPVQISQAAYYLPDSLNFDGQHSREEAVAGLPVGAGDPWTINFYVRPTRQPDNRTLIAGFGAAEDAAGKARYLSKFANGIHFWSAGRDGETNTALDVGRWQMLSATYDGETLRIYKNAVQIGQTAVQLGPDESVVRLAPLEPWDQERRFEGDIRGFSIWKEPLAPETLAALLKDRPGQ
jgi:alpha-mannosidase